MTAQHDNTIEHEPSTPERSEEVEDVEGRMGTTTNENENENDNATTTEHDSPRQRVQVQGLPLDWTQLGVNTTSGDDNNNSGDHPPIVLRFPSDVVDIPMEETELCIVGTAGQKITVIGNDFSRTVNTEMTSLILRSHIIRKMEGLQYFTKLDLLELYDNQIDTLGNLNDGVNGSPGATTLRVLDMSYNSIRDMQPVQFCPHLQELCKCGYGGGWLLVVGFLPPRTVIFVRNHCLITHLIFILTCYSTPKSRLFIHSST